MPSKTAHILNMGENDGGSGGTGGGDSDDDVGT